MKISKSNLFLIKFIGVIALYYAIIYLAGTEWLNPYLYLSAKLSSWILSIFHSGIVASNEIINGLGCAIVLSYGCDGTDQFIVFIAGVIAFPSDSKKKWLGLGIGIPTIYFLNLFRIIGLLYIQAFWPDNFDIFHEMIFPVVFIIISIALWIYWLKWSKKYA